MTIAFDPEEYIAALGDLTPIVDQPGGYQGTIDILNQFAGNKGSGSYNIPNGGFAIPTTVSPFSSGLNYAQSIAGGQNVPGMIAPGVSYSSAMPQGFTQADLNGTPPPPPPVYKEPDDPSFFGTGIGGVTIPGGRRDKMPPLRNIFGDLGGGKSGPGYDSIGMPTVGNGPGFFDPNYSLDKLNIDKYRTKVPPSGSVNYGQAGQQTKPLGTDVTGYKVPAEQEVQVPPQEFNIEQIRQDIADSGIDFTNLFGLPQAPDLSQFVTKDDLPNGRDFSVDQLNLPDFNEFALRKDLPVYQEPDLSGFARIEDLPTFNPDELRKDILMSLPAYEQQDLSGFARIEDLPTFNPDELRKDIMMSLPTYEQQDLSGFARIEDLPTFNPDELKQDILMSLPEQQMQDLSGFMTQDDINKAIAGINMPTYEQPDLSAYDTRLADLEKTLLSLQQPTGGNFSVNQPQVRGLF